MNEKINILYIINSLQIGGSQKVLIDNINELSVEKYNFQIITLSKQKSENSIFNIVKLNKRVAIHEIDFEFPNDYSIFGYLKLIYLTKQQINVNKQINEIAFSFKPHIIHFHTSPRELVLKRFIEFNSKYIFTDHTLRVNKTELGIIKTKFLSRLFKQLYNSFNVIAVSKAIKENLYANGVIDKKIEIGEVINGVYLNNELYEENIRNNELVLIYVSRICAGKGHEVLIRAWQTLSDISQKKLILVGEDSLNGEIQNLTKVLNCNDTVVFTGSVSDPLSYLKESNMGVFPSFKEGLPLALLEKMSIKLPVIVSDIPELTSIIENFKNGLTFKVGDFQDLANKIRYLYQNTELKIQLGESAKDFIEEEYDIKKNIQALDNYYQNITLRNV